MKQCPVGTPNPLFILYEGWNTFCGKSHPWRPRSSQSGQEKRKDKSFQVRAKEPLGTDSHQTISKPSSGCRLLIGPKKCFVLLCPIGEHISRVLFMCSYTTANDGYCLDHGLCGSCTKEMHAVRKPSVWYKIPIWFQITVCPKTKDVFPKIQASAYNRYSRLHRLQLAYIFMREFLKDTTTADSHENVAWKSELIFFSVSIVFIPTNLLCQMQANSSGAEFLSTIS